jgi:hypothetical protein
VINRALGGAAGVAVVQTADVRNGQHLAQFGRLDFTRNRRVSVQGQMRAMVVIILDVSRQDSHQVRLVKHDHVIQALATNGSDHALDVGILPRRLRCTDHFFDPVVPENSVRGDYLDGGRAKGVEKGVRNRFLTFRSDIVIFWGWDDRIEPPTVDMSTMC